MATQPLNVLYILHSSRSYPPQLQLGSSSLATLAGRAGSSADLLYSIARLRSLRCPASTLRVSLSANFVIGHIMSLVSFRVISCHFVSFHVISLSVILCVIILFRSTFNKVGREGRVKYVFLGLRRQLRSQAEGKKGERNLCFSVCLIGRRKIHQVMS
jgi:hypothetical protein